MPSALQKYFRAEKLFISLPSGQNWYKNNEVSFTNSGEVGVKAMTSRDEMMFKNPDMLLNGESLIRVIRSCVPCINEPEKLLTNDVDAIIVAIRHATFGKTMDVVRECPNCGSENTYGVDLDGVISSIEHMESDYTIELSSGITLHVKPLCLSESFGVLESQFKQQKMLNLLDENDEVSDEEKGKIFQKEFEKMVDLKGKIITDSVYRITHAQDGLDITNKSDIQEFLNNTERAVIEEIDRTLKRISKIGIKSDFDLVCEKCEHEWNSDIDFNPVTFFTKS